MSENNPGGRPQETGLFKKLQSFGLWNIAPVISGLLFLLVSWFCAHRLNLYGDTSFQWHMVRTNLDQIITNSAVRSNSLDMRFTTTFTNTVTFTNTQVITNTLVITNGSVITNLTVVPNMFLSTNRVVTNSVITTNSVFGTNTVIANSQIQHHRLTRELLLRLLWGVSCVALTILCLGVVAFSLNLTHQLGKRPALRMVIISTVIVLGLYLGFSFGRVADLSGGQAVEQLMKATGPPEISATSVRDSAFAAVVPQATILVACLSALTVVTLTIVALGASYLLHGMQKATESEKFNQLADSGQNLMGLTAMALVAGTIEVYLVISLAAQHVYPILLYDVQQFGTALATVAGLIYSGFLIAIFTPLVIGQREYGKVIAQSMAQQARAAQARAAQVTLGQVDAVELQTNASQSQADAQKAKEAALIEPPWQRIVKSILAGC